MKWITPLWSDPVGWSEKVVKTDLRVFIGMLIQLTAILLGLHKMTPNAFTTSGATGIILLFGVIFPCMYLYAMYRLLKIIKEKDQDSE